MDNCPTPGCKGVPAVVKAVPARYRQEFYKSEYLGLGKIRGYECKTCFAELYYAFANHKEYPRLVTAKQYEVADLLAGNAFIGSTSGAWSKRHARGIIPPRDV